MWPSSSATAWVLIVTALPASGFQLLPRTPETTSTSSLAYHHNDYVDQKIQSAPYTNLNHEFWHQRNVITSSSNLPKTSAASIAAASTSALSSVNTDPRNPRLAETLDLSTSNTVQWESRQEFDCEAALDAMNGVADNPSGIAACYHVQGLNNAFGVFHAGLRLYHMAAPTGVWVQVKADAVSIGINFGGASVSQQTTGKKKRDNDAAMWVSRMEEKPEGRQSLLKRSVQPPPRLIEDLSFLCVVHSSLVNQLGNSEKAYKILVPSIELYGTTANGTSITTSLALSYVSNFFSKTTDTSDEAWTPEQLEYAKKGLGLTNTFAVFPIGFVITSVWATILLAVTGYGTHQRIKSRDSYRRRLKRSLSNRPAKAYVETRSGVQFEDVTY